MAEWLGRWTFVLVVPVSSPPLCSSLELFSVAPSQLVCLLPVGIFNPFMFIYNVCFLLYLHWP